MEAPEPAQALPLVAEGGSPFKHSQLFQAAAMARPLPPAGRSAASAPANKGAPRPDTPSQPAPVVLCARS
jgi:hypothetical protein